MLYSLGDDGTFDIGPATVHLTLEGGLEGIESVPPGSPGFEDHSVVIAKYNMGAIDAYEVDAEGTPIPSTKRPFVTDLSHVLGAYLDPVSGSFLFSTWWTDSTIVVVEGFARADSVDLGITVSAPASAIVGDEMVVDLEVTNHGPGASAPTTASVTLPAGLTYSDAATGCAHAGSSVTCAIPALDAGASIIRSITLTAGGAESLTVSATVPVTRLDPVGANNSDSSTVVVSSPTTTTTTTTTAPTTTTEEGGSSTTVAPETATTAAVGGAGLTASTTVSSEGSAPPARGSLPRTGASIPPVALGVSLTLVGFLFAIGARHRRVVSGRD